MVGLASPSACTVGGWRVVPGLWLGCRWWWLGWSPHIPGNARAASRTPWLAALAALGLVLHSLRLAGPLRPPWEGGRQSEGPPRASERVFSLLWRGLPRSVGRRRHGPRHGDCSGARTGDCQRVRRAPLTGSTLPLRLWGSGSAFTPATLIRECPLVSLHPGASRCASRSTRTRSRVS